VLTARYFDGKTATAHVVNLTLEAQDIVLCGANFEVRAPISDVHISERLGNTPRILTFEQGGHCEVTGHAALDELLTNVGTKSSWLDGVQHSLFWALLSAALIVAALFTAYRYLLPWGAQVIAMRTPEVVLKKMGSSTLETLDQFVLQPSKLDTPRQQKLISAYEKFQSAAHAQQQYRIAFRSSPSIGANAFALPDGTIVLLDELVTLTKDDNEIMAVLAHERGHIERRHTLRMVLQSSAVGLVVAWYGGDVSSLLSSIPAALLEARYSRNFEREADEYAEQTLKQNDLSPCLLASILSKLETAHQSSKKSDAALGADMKKTSVLDYLSSHPATKERSALLCP
jgi:Zn-dependent protease with chaperone function